MTIFGCDENADILLGHHKDKNKLNFNMFGVVQKTEYFGGYEEMQIFLGVITKDDGMTQ